MRLSRILIGTLAGTVATAAAVAVGERRLVRSMAGIAAPDDWLSPVFPEGVELMVPADDGAELRVVAAGPVDGPVVVLVHGLTSNSDDWGPVAHRLVAQGVRVVGVNQRGHGGSSVGEDGFGPRRQGADVGQVLSALDLRDVVLVGHSMGGVAAMSLMTLAPECGADRVAALTLVATLADSVRRDRRVALRFADRPQDAISGHPLHAPAVARWVFGGTPSARLVEDALASARRCPDETRIGASLGLLDLDLRNLLPSIDVPTKVICGTHDRLTSLAENRRIAERIPGAEMVVVPGAGHLVIWEQPDVMAEAIAALVNRTTAVDVD